MARTVVGVNDPKAVKKYSGFLAVDVARTSYFNRKFMGVGEEAQTPIQTLLNLENDAGDTISYDLVMQLKMEPVEGDDILRGKEEDLKFYTDEVKINQVRGGVNTGGKMSRKRTIHDLRKIARVRQKEWWARLFDELLFIYLSGARGMNNDFIYSTRFKGFAGNALVTPDSDHQLYAGAATSKASLTVADKMDLRLIDRAVARADTLGGGSEQKPSMEPVRINGEDHYVTVMHPFQVDAMKSNAATGQWLDIQKAATASEGARNPIFTGSMGMYNNVVLHKHKGVIRYNDYGAGNNVEAARALFMGRQAAVVAFGSPGTGLRFDWNEEPEDRGNQIVITTSSIFGVKKTAFNIEGQSYDFGVMALDTANIDPK